MSSPAPIPAPSPLVCNYCSCPPHVDPGCPPNMMACAPCPPAPAPAPSVIPTDDLGRIKYFLQVDGQACDSSDFGTFLAQSGFTTVTKPGSCPSGTKLFPSPSAGDTSNSEALPYVVCGPENFDMGFSSTYHSYQANYINCTESQSMGTGSTVTTVVVSILVILSCLGCLYLIFKNWDVIKVTFPGIFSS